MTKDEALKLALEALLWANKEINGWRDDAYGYEPEDQPEIMSAITALEEALAQPPLPVQERTTHITWDERGARTVNGVPDDAPRPWVGLTTVDREEIERKFVYVEGAIRMTEAKLKQKNI